MKYFVDNLTKTVLIVFVGLLIDAFCFASDVVLPLGWSIPSGIKTNDQWRDRDPNRYLYVKGDFNGDGVIDQARLLIRDKDNAIGFFVFLSQRNGTFKTIKLDVTEDPIYIKVLGIELVIPGRYKTVCGKGIVECTKDLKEEIVLKYQGISFFKEDSAEMYFYWDESEKSFKHAGIED